MCEEGKIENTVNEMQRLNLSILGISEMRWSGTGQRVINNHTVYYSGNDDTNHRNGVAVILEKNVARSVKNVIPYSDRMILVQIETTKVNTNIIQVYAPTSTAEDEEIESFYEDMNYLMRQLKNNDITIVMGDLNAKIGQGKQDSIVGDFGLGVRNERGDMFFNFCAANDLVITNTFYKLPPRRLYTWRAPGDSKENIIRNQIDYITINKRYRNSIQSAKTYPGADVNSDHNLLVAEVNLRFKKLNNKKTLCPKIDHEKLKNKEVIEEASNILKERLRIINTTGIIENEMVEELWKGTKEAINEITQNKFIEKRERSKKQQWMTSEILGLMEKRRHLKQNKVAYKEAQKEIRRKIRQAKEEWHAQQCTELEGYDILHDSFNQHKMIRKMVKSKKGNSNGILMNEDNILLLSEDDRLEEWKKYILELFDDDRGEEYVIENITTGPSILVDEIQKAIKNSKNRKAPGPDSIHTEIMKLFDSETLKPIAILFNNIYNTGLIPDDWLKSVFVTLPKIPNAKKCNQYRTISLMSHALKIFLKVIHQRIHRKIEENLGITQFGFRGGLGTREALFCLQVLIQRCRDINQDVYACFIDFEKAFDRVQHTKLVEILRKIKLDDKDIRIIANLYWQQKATVRTENRETEEVKIKRGVRQGCVLSPLLFNLYSEELFNEALEDSNEGISINGTIINNIRYADDTVILASNINDLQSILNKVVRSCEKFGLNINTKKTKYMVISKENQSNTNLLMKGQQLEKVDKIKYLGCNLNSDWETSREIKSRIEQARATFTRMQNIFKSHNLSMDLKIRMIRCYVFPVLLYGMEAWTITETILKKVQAFEMWIYRRMLRISWKDKIRNTEVMAKMKKNVELVDTIKARKLEYFAHIMRNEHKYGLLQLILQGKITGRRSRGRRRTSWMGNLKEWYKMSSEELFRAAEDRQRIRNMVVNVRQRT
ncbi:hypothetical protein M8J77_022354 [Diaphorina citri]|nr:hypothetical protein M8J77_022354 [Diaphorina citri]